MQGLRDLRSISQFLRASVKALFRCVPVVRVRGMATAADKTFLIEKTWNGIDVRHSPVKLCLSSQASTSAVLLDVDAPFFNDPPAPAGRQGEPFDHLWDYEVVEAFFLGDRERYLEVELCPHGQHLVLMLEGVRQVKQTKLPLTFKATVDQSSKRWTGRAVIPQDYFPPNVSLFNGYAIHGSGDQRTYESLYPTDTGKFEQPDFHRLQFFKRVDFSDLIKTDGTTSSLWGK